MTCLEILLNLCIGGTDLMLLRLLVIVVIFKLLDQIHKNSCLLIMPSA